MTKNNFITSSLSLTSEQIETMNIVHNDDTSKKRIPLSLYHSSLGDIRFIFTGFETTGKFKVDFS